MRPKPFFEVEGMRFSSEDAPYHEFPKDGNEVTGAKLEVATKQNLRCGKRGELQE